MIQSTHKTLPAFTQSAMLHVQGSRVLKDKVRERLSLFQSSSPSYLLMAGLDYCRYQLERQENLDFDQFIEQLYELRKNLSPLSTLELMDQKIEGQGSIDEIDISKILLSCRYCRESGADIESILRKEYQIQMELSAPHHLLGITTVADSKKGFQRLTQALCSIDGKLKKVYKKADINFIWDNIPSIQYTPREASFMSTDFFPLKRKYRSSNREFVILTHLEFLY